MAGLEVGRVADDVDDGELRSNMKITGLLGLRAMLNSLIVHADLGVTDKGEALHMTIDQLI